MPGEKQKYTTYCNIPNAEGQPCGAAIAVTPGIIEPELGKNPDDRTKKYVQAIVGHLMKKHPELAHYAMATMEQFLGYIAVGFTQTEDPGAVSFMAHFAEYLCQISTLPVTDAMIETMVGNFESDAEELSAVLGLTMEDPNRELLIKGMHRQRKQIIDAITYVRNFQLRKITPQSPVTSPELSTATP